MKYDMIPYGHKVLTVSSFILAFLISTSITHAATYYVSKAGNDSNSCGNARNESTPKKTITVGIGCLSGGDTLIIKGGTYSERLRDKVPSGTDLNNMTTIKASPGEKVILQPSGTGSIIHYGNGQNAVPNNIGRYVKFDGLILDGSSASGCDFGLRIKNNSGISNLIFQNGEIRNLQTFGVVAGGGTSDIWIVNNKIYNLLGEVPGSECITSGSGTVGAHGFYWRSSNGIIEHNEIYNITGVGLQFSDGSRIFTIQNNIFRYNIVHGAFRMPSLWCGSTSKNNMFLNNLIYNGGDNGITCFGGDNKGYNNTFYNIAKKGINNKASTNVFINNIVYKTAGITGVNVGNANLVADPLFVDASGGNFALQPGSPAIDAGNFLSEVTDDIEGNLRPIGLGIDIGAYEFGGSSADTNPPSPPENLKVMN